MTMMECLDCGALLAETFYQRIEGAERCYFCGGTCEPTPLVEGMANPAAWQTHLDGCDTPPRRETDAAHLFARVAMPQTGDAAGDGGGAT